MKIGIVTFHCAPSYGAFFQAYALSTYLRRFGHDVQVVDYMPQHRRDSFRRRRKSPSPRACSIRSALSWMKAWARTGFYWGREYEFSRTVKTHLPLTNIRYDSLQHLQQEPPELDACFLGSDQIWNPDKTGGYDPAYFGCFGSREMRRIAYAASFGKDHAPDWNGELSELLGKLDFVSVRERSGVVIAQPHCDLTVHEVLDPTFLIPADAYPSTNANEDGEYVLGYFIGASDAPGRVLHHIGQRMKLPVVAIPGPIGFLPLYPGPLKLLAALRRARYLVTNSFHGLALSLIHHVDFTSVGLVGPNACLNTRVVELLSKLGLSDRFVDLAHDPTGMFADVAPVDWCFVDETLRQLRSDSESFITVALTDGSKVLTTE